MGDDDRVETTIKMVRGTGSSDKETVKTTVSAPDVVTLSERVEEVREEMTEWADELRAIQPTQSEQPGDQSTLGGGDRVE